MNTAELVGLATAVVAVAGLAFLVLPQMSAHRGTVGLSAPPSMMPDEDGQTRAVRMTITSLAAVLIIAALSYAVYRSWLGPVPTVDTMGVLRAGSTHQWKLTKGTYEIQIESSVPIEISMIGSNCASNVGVAYRESCELKLDAVLALRNPREATSASTYSVEVHRLQD